MLMRYIRMAFVVALLSACSFTTREHALVSDAHAIGTRTVGDPLFREIVLELSSAGGIDWSGERARHFPAEARVAPDEWLLEQFAAHGLFHVDSIRPWAKLLPPWSHTKATSYACGPTVKLNVLRLRRSEYSVANTLVHERVHSFCQIHPESQERPPNVCDAAYVYGELAEIIARYRSGEETVTPTEEPCPSLCAALLRRGITARCSGGGRENRDG